MTNFHRKFDAVIPIAGVRLGIRVSRAAVEGVEVLPATGGLLAPATALGRQAVAAIGCYAADPANPFRLPLGLRGTAFQCRVWRALRTLPAGRTVTYGELALRLGSGARAVAGACRANPLPLLVPCHRVVAADGPGGYAGARQGWLLEFKLWLLEHERRNTTPRKGGGG